MVTPTDPNEVRMTGENSFIRLAERQGGEITTRASHWRVWLSPGGPGHVLFLESELTGGEPKIYSDNIAMVRWLQEEIEGTLSQTTGNLSLPVKEAAFSRSGDVRSFWTEYVDSRDDEISLTWFDFLEPFVIRTAPGSRDASAHGVYSTFIPGRQARLVLNGDVAAGFPQLQERDGRPSSTACLAISETWVRPYS